MTARRWSKNGVVGKAARDLRPAARPIGTTRAKYRTTCFQCNLPVLPGQGISMIKHGDQKLWRHATCALPCGPGKTADAT